MGFLLTQSCNMECIKLVNFWHWPRATEHTVKHGDKRCGVCDMQKTLLNQIAGCHQLRCVTQKCIVRLQLVHRAPQLSHE